MSDEEALLAAILADPDDDTPRLAYADWLDENGDEDRAEFIRVGVRRANAKRLTPEFHNLIGREAELLVRNRAQWVAPFAPWAWFEHLVFGRGFVEELHLPVEVYANHAADLFALSPLREIWVDVADRIVELARIPRPPHVRLRAGDYVPPGGWDPGREPVDLLPPGPPAPEPYLLRGSWLVLTFGAYSGPDLVAAHRFLTCAQNHRDWANGIEGYGLRPLDDGAEFKTWCPLPNPWQTPRWLRFLNGKLIDDRIGAEPPPEWQAHWAAG